MAFTSLLGALQRKPLAMRLLTVLIRVLVVAACAMLAWGAWQQVVVGMDSRSVVLGYPAALLPLPAFLCALAIGAMAFIELVRHQPIALGHGAEVE
jgi:gluconokinase